MENASNFSVFQDAKEDALCGALFKDDGAWYRARILSRNSEEISVQFIDYGNVSTTDEIRVLPSDLLQLPGIAEHCSLILPEGISEWSEKACSEFLSLISGGETEFRMKLVKDGALKVVSLDYNGEPVELMLKQYYLEESVLGMVSTVTDETLDTVEEQHFNGTSVSDKTLLNVNASDDDSVFVSHCDNPADFWIQRKSATEKLHCITEKMENASNFNVFPDAKEGELCGALFKDDGAWYRARILSRNNDGISVRFIDYGNTSTTDEIRVLPSDLLQMPGIAEHCSLILPEEINEWSENACSEFLNLVSGGETEFHMKLVKDGPLKVVSLDYNREPVELMLKQSYLKERGLENVCILADETSDTAEPEEKKFDASKTDIKDDETDHEYKLDDSQINDIPEVTESSEIDKQEDSEIQLHVSGGGDSVFVSHCVSPADFWVQSKSVVEKLQYVTERMKDASNFSVFSDAKEGELCAALFNDGLWYRARILSCDSKEVTVQFIDYGNISATDELRVLPSDLLQMPGIAEHCSLILPEEINEWSENACSEFLNLVSGGETEFHMKVVKEGPLKIVSLDYNGKPVELILKQSYSKESDCKKVSTPTDQSSDITEKSEEKKVDVNKPEIPDGESHHAFKETDTTTSSDNKCNDFQINDTPKVNESSEVDKKVDSEIKVHVSGGGDSVFVSHCDSPADFWIQHKSAVENLLFVTERMESASNFSVFPDAKEGEMCGALFKDDGAWYRARILSQNNDGISVRFIDYGNTSTTDEIRVLPSDLIQMPGIAEHCSLILPEGINEWPEKACSEFSRLVSGGETEFHMKLLKEGPLKVVSLDYNGEPVEMLLKQSYLKESALEKINTLTDETSDIAEESEKEMFDVSKPEITDSEANPACKEIDISVSSHNTCDDSKINDTPIVNVSSEVDKRGDSEINLHVSGGDSVFVSHCDSPSDFWIQPKSAVKNLHYVTERMEIASKFTPFPDAKEGELCGALFNDDGLWYRAKVLSRKNDNFSVQFIDYGNTSTTNALCVLPPDLLKIPGIAEHCSLILPEGINEWSENSCSEFLKLVSGGETEFHMKLVKDGPLKVISLEYNGEPVELMLNQSYSKENLQRVSRPTDETSDTVEEHLNGTSVPDKTLIQNTEIHMVHLSADRVRIEDKLPQEVQSVELLESEQKVGNQIKTKHSEKLIQDFSVEVKVQSSPDQTKKDIAVSQKECEHSPADTVSSEVSIDENDTTPDLLR